MSPRSSSYSQAPFLQSFCVLSNVKYQMCMKLVGVVLCVGGGGSSMLASAGWAGRRMDDLLWCMTRRRLSYGDGRSGYVLLPFILLLQEPQQHAHVVIAACWLIIIISSLLGGGATASPAEVVKKQKGVIPIYRGKQLTSKSAGPHQSGFVRDNVIKMMVVGRLQLLRACLSEGALWLNTNNKLEAGRGYTYRIDIMA